jgi:WD40 repeat protein
MSRSEYPADAFAAVSGSNVHLLREKPPEDGSSSSGGAPAAAFGEVVVSHSCTVNTARWNRNNKVVAAGCADGHVQLLHSGGQVMCVLPRDGTPPSAVGPVTALSWSSGSKRLAAGSANGSVFIYDMQQKVHCLGSAALMQCLPACLPLRCRLPHTWTWGLQGALILHAPPEKLSADPCRTAF